MGLVLFAYAFISNVAIALVPHEPVVIWYGAHWGIWATAAVATAGTLAASWVDHRLFVPLVSGAAATPLLGSGMIGQIRRLMTRAPFAVLALSGVMPVPSLPFKAAAFAERYPLPDYLCAVALGRFPRYALLAWLGVLLTIPGWMFVALFLLMLAPSLRMLIWKPRNVK